jgi:DNA-binding NtrC family response regulator
MPKQTILIVDDESSQRQILAGFLKQKGYGILEAASADKAIELVRKSIIDVILTDYKMPDKNGLELLKEVRRINPETAVVMVTAFGTIEDAVRAMKEGAYDYLTKPIDLDELDLLVKRIIERQQLISENRLLKEQLKDKYSFTGVIADSKEMEEVLSLAARAADSKASVLVQGESGTGKELVARTIHFTSPRKVKPFIAVNCAALNENLIESELFGHEKGAFTGADKQRAGRFEAANSGTLFLDEIGDLPLSTQVKLLRVLQEEKFERVGASESISVDVRIISATNKNLQNLVDEGKFREDLFYRLNVITISIPPLRKRRDDILSLIDFYLKRFNSELKGKKKSFSKEALDMMLKYDYPGNVRELENIVHRAVVLSRGTLIGTDDVFINIGTDITASKKSADNKNQTMSAQVERLEKKLVIQALESSAGNQSKAAKLLGISERNLRYRLNKWGLKS